MHPDKKCIDAAFVSPSGQQAFLLENVPCNSASCQAVGRMFHIHWDQSDLGAIRNATMATFFDIYEDVSTVICVLIDALSLSSSVILDGQTGKRKFNRHMLRLT